MENHNNSLFGEHFSLVLVLTLLAWMTYTLPEVRSALSDSFVADSFTGDVEVAAVNVATTVPAPAQNTGSFTIVSLTSNHPTPNVGQDTIITARIKSNLSVSTSTVVYLKDQNGNTLFYRAPDQYGDLIDWGDGSASPTPTVSFTANQTKNVILHFTPRLAQSNPVAPYTTTFMVVVGANRATSSISLQVKPLHPTLSVYNSIAPSKAGATITLRGSYFSTTTPLTVVFTPKVTTAGLTTFSLTGYDITDNYLFLRCTAARVDICAANASIPRGTLSVTLPSATSSNAGSFDPAVITEMYTGGAFNVSISQSIQGSTTMSASRPFTIISVAPTLVSATPAAGKAGAIITLHGTNFPSDTDITVKFTPRVTTTGLKAFTLTSQATSSAAFYITLPSDMYTGGVYDLSFSVPFHGTTVTSVTKPFTVVASKKPN